MQINNDLHNVFQDALLQSVNNEHALKIHIFNPSFTNQSIFKFSKFLLVYLFKDAQTMETQTQRFQTINLKPSKKKN